MMRKILTGEGGHSMRALATISALAALSLGLGACGSLRQNADFSPPPPPISAAVSMPGALEPIYAAAVSSNQAIFRVTSNGCTGKDDIQPVVRRVGDSALITLRRMKDDRCSNVQLEGIDVIYSLEELGLSADDHIEINNPYLLGPDEDAEG
ncbi:hypothetical protein [Brevundimonas lutea]|uniref:hypothetical protein n=1 Tax=Brevundimonas lutea TaxID=2293980 RepID=UPI00196A2567|nr:hypothetical protein [Brevundimonas lutea]